MTSRIVPPAPVLVDALGEPLPDDEPVPTITLASVRASRDAILAHMSTRERARIVFADIGGREVLGVAHAHFTEAWFRDLGRRLVDGLAARRYEILAEIGYVELRLEPAIPEDWRDLFSEVTRYVVDRVPAGVRFGVRVSPCIAHDDCREHPELGADCRRAGDSPR